MDRNSEQVQDSGRQEENSTLKIPVVYYPPAGLKNLKKDAEGVFEVPSHEVALVLVDTWNGDDPEEGDEPPQYLKDAQAFLHACRAHGVSVIHAPNHPVVDKYSQYHKIKETVQDFMKDYPTKSETPPFLSWPPQDSDVYRQARQLRTAQPSAKHRMPERDISCFLTPLEDEFVLESYDEFRYVLWKQGVKLLLYVGGALNECMQHRDTGINRLAGMDRQRTAFTIVVLGDCSYAKVTPGLDVQVMAQAMLEYFKCKITFVAHSKDVVFFPKPE